MNAKQLKLLVTAHVWRSGELWFSPSTTGVIRPRGRSLKLLSHLGGSPGFHLLVTDHYITKEMKICTEGFPVSSEIWYLTWQAAATVTIIYGWEQNLGSPLLLWSLGKLSVFQGACFGGLRGYTDAQWKGHDSILTVLVVNGCSFTCMLGLFLRKISYWPGSYWSG